MLVETISTSTPEPEYDELDRAMFDALLDYRDDLHSCGRPLSESLHDVSKANSEQVQYVVGTQTCRACQALDKFHAELYKRDAKLREAGRNPDAWRLHTVVPDYVAQALVATGGAAEKT